LFVQTNDESHYSIFQHCPGISHPWGRDNRFRFKRLQQTGFCWYWNQRSLKY
jgi:hypothetical protein